MEIIIVLFRTLLFYVIIALVYRFMGKREVGELSIMDLIVSILIAELVIIGIENYNDDIFISIVPILILLVLQVSLAFLSLRFAKFRIFLDGNPSIMIKNGKVNYKEMVSQKYNLDDLLVQLREKGYRSIEEIEYAILESSGNLSVFPFSKGKKSTPLPLPLILDGDIQMDTLKIINKDKKWVYNILKNKGILLEEVFYAFYRDNNFFIIKRSDLL
jgi:uncharacterized membrane protein YcaP (DUF421 family)